MPVMRLAGLQIVSSITGFFIFILANIRGIYSNFTVDGWPNGFAFVLSFLAPVWTINGFDSAVHISEEAANARTAVPFAIIASTLVAGVLGWGKSPLFS